MIWLYRTQLVLGGLCEPAGLKMFGLKMKQFKNYILLKNESGVVRKLLFKNLGNERKFGDRTEITEVKGSVKPDFSY